MGGRNTSDAKWYFQVLSCRLTTARREGEPNGGAIHRRRAAMETLHRGFHGADCYQHATEANGEGHKPNLTRVASPFRLRTGRKERFPTDAQPQNFFDTRITSH